MALQKKCLKCQSPFDIPDEDLVFYDKISPEFGKTKCPIPPPTLCPDCRYQRRIAWRNERNLYNRKCDLCQKPIISLYSPEKTYTVYCQRCWWSDKWDPFQFSKEFDFKSPFFNQFTDLYKSVPLLAIQNDNGVSSENCEYCQDFAFGKNCYLITGSWYLRDSFYGDTLCKGADIVDSTYVYNSELVYESLYCDKLYNCIFVQNSENCQRCVFGFDLKGCSDCFACFGLRQKRFYIFNQPYSETEYKAKMRELRVGSSAGFQKVKEEFQEWIKQFPRKATNQKNCENCVGNNLFHCKNTTGFDLFDSENSKYFTRSDKSLFCYDIHQSGNPQWCYESMTPDNSYMVAFSLWCWKDKNVLYSDNCHSSEYLFGCMGLKHAKYCILNKQYTKEEYESLVPQIIEQMAAAGEWGELFPIRMSPFAYNETLVQTFFPLSREEASAAGYVWKDADKKDYLPQMYSIPDAIEDVPDTIVKETLSCQKCHKNYRIIPTEFAFYRKMVLPIPLFCPLCRHSDRFSRSAPHQIFSRKCAKCGKDIQTTYSPDKPETVYCEDCYLSEVY